MARPRGVRPYAFAISDVADLPVYSVLVIEDEPGIVDFVQRGLEALVTGSARSDGITGERAGVRAARLVVLDMMLPGRNGMQVLARIRGDQTEVCR